MGGLGGEVKEPVITFHLRSDPPDSAKGTSDGDSPVVYRKSVEITSQAGPLVHTALVNPDPLIPGMLSPDVDCHDLPLSAVVTRTSPEGGPGHAVATHMFAVAQVT
jgi:hypothetical protein